MFLFCTNICLPSPIRELFGPLQFANLDLIVLGEKSRFPDFYPSGCLLGCVDIVDCLSQQEYSEKVGPCLKPLVSFCHPRRR